MFLSIVAIAFSYPQTLAPSTPQWIVDLMRSSRALKIPDAIPLKPMKGTAEIPAPEFARRLSVVGPGSRNPNLNPAAIKELRSVNAAIDSAMDLVARKQYLAANRYFEAFVGAHPHDEFFCRQFLVDSELLVGHFDDAYQNSVQALRNPLTASNDYLWLQLSLASAKGGDEFPGQMSFCIQEVAKGLYNRGQSYSADPSLARSRKPGAIAAQSYLALGLRSESWIAIPYFEAALRSDPVNVPAGRELVVLYDLMGRFSDESRVTAGLVTHLPQGKDKDYFQRQWELSKGRPDRPYHVPARAGTTQRPNP